MKRTFVDEETGWTVIQETSIGPQWIEIVKETIIKPRTGNRFNRTRTSNNQQSIAEWVQAISQGKEDTIKSLPEPRGELACELCSCERFNEAHMSDPTCICGHNETYHGMI